MKTLKFDFAGVKIFIQSPSIRVLDFVDEYFAHHKAEFSQPDAQITLWEKKIFSPIPTTARLALRYFGLKIFFEQGWTYFTDFYSYLILNPEAREAFGYISSETIEEGLDFFAGIVLTFLFYEILRHRKRFFLHSSAVISSENKIFLFPASSGQGKTTLTVYLLQNGYKFLSDDTIFILPNSDQLVFSGLKKPVHLPIELAQKFSNFDIIAQSPELKGLRKKIIDLEKIFPQAQIKKASGDYSIIFLEKTDKPKSYLEPISKAEALVKLLEQSPFVFINPALAQSHLKTFSKLVNSAKKLWQLKSARDWLENPILLKNLLERAGKE